MPLVTQYADRLYGNITFIGNTLGLSRRENNSQQTGQRVPGTLNIAGAFVTTDTTSRCGNATTGYFPYGTTCNLPLNTMYVPSSSEAVLNLPPNVEVVYAELIWGGSYRYPSISIEANINDPVSFKTPSMSNPIQITPIAVTRNAFKMVSTSEIYAYTRSAIVTSYVRQGGNGTYRVGSVPAVISANDINEANGFGGSGWTLAVIYRYLTQGFPLRSITLYVGGVPIVANTSAAIQTLTGFVTPSQPANGARLLLSAFEGDYSIVGEQVFFATQGNSNLTTPLSGPNNLATNFFASQINDDQGRLNTSTGTFSTRNHTLNIAGTAYTGVSAARQGWDITNIAIPSSHIGVVRNSGTLRVETTGDSILLNAAAIVMETNEPNLELVKSSNVTKAALGDEVLYTVKVSNSGTAQAENIQLLDVIPQGMAFVPNSVTINYSQPTTYSVVTGVPLGTLLPGAAPTVVQFKLKVTATLDITAYDNVAKANYSYYLQPNPYTRESNMVTIEPVIPRLMIEKSVSPSVIPKNGILTYTIKVTNTGNTPLTNIRIYDTNIPVGLVVDERSIRLDGQQVTGTLKSGILISRINEKTSRFITFKASVSSTY